MSNDPGMVGVNVNAGPVTATGLANASIGHQVIMGDTGLYLHFQPEIARQWIEALTPIATMEVK